MIKLSFIARMLIKQRSHFQAQFRPSISVPSIQYFKFNTKIVSGMCIMNKSYEEILTEHKIHQKITQIEKFDARDIIIYINQEISNKQVSVDTIKQIGFYAINLLRSKGDNKYAMICCENIIQFLKGKGINDLYLCQLYGLMSSLASQVSADSNKSMISQGREEQMKYLTKSEEVLAIIQNDLEEQEQLQIFEMLALGNRDAERVEKCAEFAGRVLQLSKISSLEKTNSLLTLIDALSQLNKSEEAIIIGEKFIKSIKIDLNQLKEQTSNPDNVEIKDQIEALMISIERIISLKIQKQQLLEALVLQEILSFSLAIIEGVDSWKYQEVNSWKTNYLYNLALSDNDDLSQVREVVSSSEQLKELWLSKDQSIQFDQKVEMKQNVEEKLKNIKQMKDMLKHAINTHHQINELGLKAVFSQEDQAKYVQLIEQGIELNNNLQGMPIIDFQFVKNALYKDQHKIPKEQADNLIKKLHFKL